LPFSGLPRNRDIIFFVTLLAAGLTHPGTRAGNDAHLQFYFWTRFKYLAVQPLAGSVPMCSSGLPVFQIGDFSVNFL
jgi:hypothetical protein